MVPVAGLEPARLSATGFKPATSAIPSDRHVLFLSSVVKVLVPKEGLEPSLPKEETFEVAVSTNSTTRAYQVP